MVTIPIEAEVSVQQLLDAVSQLPQQEFAAFVDELFALRARRAGPHLDQVGTALLLQVNEALPEQTQQRFDALVGKRQAETITAEELGELIGLTDQIEHHDALRLAALQELAQVRAVPLGELMASLGIHPRPVPEECSLGGLCTLCA